MKFLLTFLLTLILTGCATQSPVPDTFAIKIKSSDNRELLDDQRINPQFSKLVKSFLDKAELNGFKPFIKEAFRSQEEAKMLAKKNKELKIAAAEVSLHSFGMAVDIWLKNEKGEAFSYEPIDYKKNPTDRLSYFEWMKFIKIGQSFGLINAEKHSDTDHWEYHPNWRKDDWVSAKDYALPIYKKFSDLHKNEIEIFHEIWKSAGLEY
jgi:hypothetical protein